MLYMKLIFFYVLSDLSIGNEISVIVVMFDIAPRYSYGICVLSIRFYEKFVKWIAVSNI